MLPMLFVTSTTLTAAGSLVWYYFPQMIRDGKVATGYLNIALTVFVVASVLTLVVWSIARWIGVWLGKRTPTPEKA